MSNDPLVDDAKRIRREAKINGTKENIYFLVGDDYIIPKSAYENRPENEELWQKLRNVCDNLTIKMGGDPFMQDY